MPSYGAVEQEERGLSVVCDGRAAARHYIGASLDGLTTPKRRGDQRRAAAATLGDDRGGPLTGPVSRPAPIFWRMPVRPRATRPAVK